MDRFYCNNDYENYLKEYESKVFGRLGVSSPSAEREIICMAESGNTVAYKLYADLIYYKKIMRKNRYRDAFDLYLKSAGINVDENGEWNCSGDSYPLAFWIIGYYLVNYKRESVLKDVETIDIIENMPFTERLKKALMLAEVSIEYIDAPGALNLMGRVLYEIADNNELFEKLGGFVSEYLTGRTFANISFTVGYLISKEDFRETAESFLVKAAEEGYVYACNSLAAREAERIINADDSDSEKISDLVLNYICFLKLAADKFEPYAANRLGLFYVTGEITSGEKKKRYKEYIDRSKAKEYFIKATTYPDANAAWGYFNLMKYFYNDYDNNIELMNEHMDYIKELNPKVYDIAMDL